MTTLVIGGAASGKSSFAENLVLRCNAKPLYYIATLMPFDEEDHRRIARHREMRKEKGFHTLERYTCVGDLSIPERGAALLECLGNLTANELFSPEGAGDGAVDTIVFGVLSLAERCEDLIVVTNDVFADGVVYPEETARYLKTLAAVNAALARQFDRVYEVVCGIPILLKGEVL